jgi:RNA polymerase sigma-70 factor (ECF subfamily)
MKDEIRDQNLRQLAGQAKNGDTQAFDRLHQELLTPIYRYVYYRVRRKEDAEDITQTVFLKAFQAFPRYEDTGISPLAYFYSIARNTVIDHWRKKGEILFEDMGEGKEDISDDRRSEHSLLERVWAQEIIAEGIAVLTPLEAEALTLKYLHDRSNSEIAALLRKTEEAVRQLQSRGLRKMRGSMNLNDTLI